MAHSKSKKYDLELDYAIIKALKGRDLGYRDLFNVIKAHVNSFDTFNRHINHLTDFGLIKKNTKHAPFHLTEECRQRLRLKALNLVSPTLDESSSSTQLANRQIDMYILVLLSKLGTNYEFERMEELENFLFILGLSIKSFVTRTVTADMEVWESNDGKISIIKRKYLLSPHRNAITFSCGVKGIKYPIDRLSSDLFRKMNLTQDEILNTLSFLSNEGVLQQPIEYSNDKIYLVTDLRLYDLLNEYSHWYDVSGSTLKKLWNLRRPTSEEIRWLQRIEGNEKVTRSIIRSQDYRNRVHHTYYERTKQIKGLKKKISKTEMNDLTIQRNLKKQQEWIKKYHKITKPKEPTIK